MIKLLLVKIFYGFLHVIQFMVNKIIPVFLTNNCANQIINFQ